MEIHILDPIPLPPYTHSHMKPNIKKKSIFHVDPMNTYRGIRGIAPLILIQH